MATMELPAGGEYTSSRSSFEVDSADSGDEIKEKPLLRSRRFQSEGVSSMSGRAQLYGSLHKDPDDARSLSTGDSPQKMNRLMFEDIDLLNTPLSSLRSCSEYTRYSLQAAQQHAKMLEERTKKEVSSSVVSYLIGFIFPSLKKKPKNRVRFRDSTEDQVFLVERLRFNEANLLEGEDYNYGGGNSSSGDGVNSRQISADRGSDCGANRPVSTSCISDALIPRWGSSRNSSSDYFEHNFRPRKKRTTILGETRSALEYVLGFSSSEKDIPMEIELKVLKSPQYPLNTDTYDATSVASANQIDYQEEIQQVPPGLRRISSLGILPRNRSDSDVSSVRPSTPRSVRDAPRLAFDIYNYKTWMPTAQEMIEDARVVLYRDYLVNFRSSDDFYECIRIQPFACGSYLRAMLVSGFCNTLFNTYSVILWPTNEDMGTMHVLISNVLYTTVLFQMVMHGVVLPLRIHVHYMCWESSRAVEVDQALLHLREMFGSESWLVNRMIGTALDVVAFIVLLFNELYIWATPSSDPLRSLIISLSATTLMTFVMRAIVATLFGLSMHDPHVLSEARRRGLSKWDLAVLPAFVFSCPSEVNNPDCSICLAAFEQGEMLTSLPCDKKHSFHSACIRQWLERQNSCPLCQRLV